MTQPDYTVQGLLQDAPILSKYHGTGIRGGFDVDRFIDDYLAWQARARELTAATPAPDAAGDAVRAALMREQQAGVSYDDDTIKARDRQQAASEAQFTASMYDSPAAAARAREASEGRRVIDSGRTHWEGCWRDPKHHACAVAIIETRAAYNAMEPLRKECGEFVASTLPAGDEGMRDAEVKS